MTMRAADRLASVRAEIRARQEPDRIFASLGSEDPRWAIIQELEAAALAALVGGEGSEPWMPLGKLIQAAGMTQTTGLRIIDALVVGGWLQSKRDPADDRRRLIALSAKAVAAIGRYRARFGYPRPAPARRSRRSRPSRSAWKTPSPARRPPRLPGSASREAPRF